MTLPSRHIRNDYVLYLVCLSVFVCAIIRASMQSITFDEAFSYLYFAKSLDSVGIPTTNNHVLNSLLMWVATHLFGPAAIVIRMPALLGAALYISVCLYLCRRLTDRFILRFPLLICLIYNPFIVDFFVAARGYGLANAFLIIAIAVPVWHAASLHRGLVSSCAIASFSLGLSFTANFSFAIIDLIAFLALLTWALSRRKHHSVARIAGACILPGLLIALIITGYTLTHWQVERWREEFWWGAHSLLEMGESLSESSLYEINPAIYGFLRSVALGVQLWLLPTLGLLCLIQVMVLAIRRPRWLAPAGALISMIVVSVITSWLAFHYRGVPLPMGRTGIYFVPLLTLAVGVIAASPASPKSVERRLCNGLIGILICAACYFLLCTRVSYFREYRWNADTKQTYAVLADLNHRHGVKDAQVSGMYVTALNYYREVSGRETFPEFRLENPEVSSGRDLYVMGEEGGREFIARENLSIIFRGKFSDVVVAIKQGGPVPDVLSIE